MCRIAGIISEKQSAATIRQKVALMCRAQQHGGPDDEGIFTDENTNLAFGHRRLSIIDLSGNGHQPMANTGNNAWVTFNGEIYNFTELKTELLNLGAQFKSDTDTEVILLAYLQWGTASFSKLKGMFAFALYDVSKALTYLVRDSAGIKPLYYSTTDDELSFASEIKAFEQAGVKTTKDPNWQVRFLAYGHIPEPYTTLKDVFSLQKGHFLCWHHQSNTFNIKPYTTGSSNTPLITNVNEARQLLHASLKASIKKQLIADAPIGVFLSGGIDSSLITLLADEQQKDKLKTISIFFDEKSYDERSFQNIITSEIQGEKFSHLVKQQDFEAAFPQIIAAMDMPTTDGINSWFISKYAHEDGLKAVLSGIGADELFGGYPSFNRIKYLGYLRKLPAPAFSAISRFIPDNYKKLRFLTVNHYAADYLSLRGLFTPGDIAAVLDTDLAYINNILFKDELFDIPDNYNAAHASWFETNLYMQNQLLRDTDVMSMAHGLEVRVPFLDEDFIKAANSIAPQIRFNKQQSKKILIDSFHDLLPAQIWNRPKMGFTFPLQQWMNELEIISNAGNYRGLYAKASIKKFKENKMHWSKAFALYHLQNNA